MESNNLRHLFVNRKNGVQTRGRFLKDIGDLLSANLSEFFDRLAQERLPIKQDFTPDDAGRRLRKQPSERKGGYTFSASALSPNGQSLPVRHGKSYRMNPT